MPISAEKMKLYPGGSIRSPEWLEIRARIQRRARFRCEECSVRDKAWGWRDESGKFHYANKGALIDVGYTKPPFELTIHDPTAENPHRCRVVKIIAIVCTTAHLDNDLVDHSDKNLRFWCQRCHNGHDVHHRKVNAAATRRARAALGDLFEVHSC